MTLIGYDSLTEGGKALYDYAHSLIVSEPDLQYGDNCALDFGLEASIEGYIHTDTGNTVDEDDWFHGFTSPGPFLNLTFESRPGDSFYGCFEYNNGYGVGTGDNPLCGNTFNVNALPFQLPSNGNAFAVFDWTFPSKAPAATGEAAGDHGGKRETELGKRCSLRTVR